MIEFKELEQGGLAMTGYIPTFLSEGDPRPAREQLNANYQHGGGWIPFGGFELRSSDMALLYPDDPPLRPIASANLREERILIYPYAWVLIMQPDGSWEVARMD